MKLIHDLAGFTAGIGITAALVGVFDRVTARADIGVSLLIGGVCVLAASIVVLAVTSRRYSLRSALVLAGGVLPFAAFGLFLVWRIGLSVEQNHDCDQGDAVACRTLGERRFKREKLDDARTLLNRGCELSDAESCMLAASVEQRQHGKGTDRYQALMHRGCELGSGLSCYRLYLIIEEDPGSAANLALPDGEQLALLQRACDLGYRAACVDLGRPAPAR